MNDSEKIAALQNFADAHGGSTQADLALLQAGSFAAQKGDKAQAIALYDKVAANSKGDDAYRRYNRKRGPHTGRPTRRCAWQTLTGLIAKPGTRCSSSASVKRPRRSLPT